MRREWLIELRGQFTQEQISLLAGISRSAYSNIELGSRTPSVRTAKAIAKALKFDWQLFFDSKGFVSKHNKKTA
jgi:transcriptional regulator with XRE-family HTH domain